MIQLVNHHLTNLLILQSLRMIEDERFDTAATMATATIILHREDLKIDVES